MKRISALVLAAFLVSVSALAQPALPKGYTIPDSTLSPDGVYGVTVPEQTEAIPYEAITDVGNDVLEVKTGKVVLHLKANTAWVRLNHIELDPTRWTKDSSTFLWQVEGKWSPWAVVLVNLKADKPWQVNLLDLAQKAALERANKAAAKKYAAARKQNAGNGSAFPDGFTVDVQIAGEGALTFPLKVHVSLTSNPKGIEDYPKDAQLDAEMDATVDEQGKLSVTAFKLVDAPGN